MTSNFAALDIHISLPAETLFSVGSFGVTNAMVTGALSLVIFVAVFVYVSYMVRHNKYNRFVGFMQWAFEGMVAQIDSVISDKKLARRITPLGITLFFYVIISYWMSVLPGLETITVHHVPVIRSIAADLNFTFAITIIAFITVQVYAIRQHGILGNVWRYLKNPFKQGPIAAFEGALELIGEVSRYSALSLRLFGNCFAGEILLVIIGVLTSYFSVAALPIFMGFELFIGLIQAYVFFILTIIFTALAVETHGHSEEAPEHVKTPSKHSTTGFTKTSALEG
ncbi:MAG: F0F1 ATP synthase subunit A [Candidatus Saccharimonas sp.]